MEENQIKARRGIHIKTKGVEITQYNSKIQSNRTKRRRQIGNRVEEGLRSRPCLSSITVCLCPCGLPAYAVWSVHVAGIRTAFTLEACLLCGPALLVQVGFVACGLGMFAFTRETPVCVPKCITQPTEGEESPPVVSLGIRAPNRALSCVLEGENQGAQYHFGAFRTFQVGNTAVKSRIYILCPIEQQPQKHTWWGTN